mmetsp:Transcript_14557/g.26904  ORF Transcript_14557/g.26904 Transcript_14557/m.26904 type:complete len:255 (-) Transcript_14557:468-1232(-)
MTLPPSNLMFSLPQLEQYLTETADQFCLDMKGNGDADAERCREVMSAFLGYAEAKNRALEKESREAGEMLTTIVPVHNTASIPMRPSSPPTQNSEFSSTGKIKSTRTSIARLKTNKVAPMPSQTSTALAVFSSPEANQYIENLNKDLDFENEKVLQMDNVVQQYTEEEDAMITSGLGLIAGMEMKGAIAFRDFKTSFSATKFLKGYYNSKEGDVYGMSEFTVRGDVSQAAGRLINFWHTCKNPAFGRIKETSAR